MRLASESAQSTHRLPIPYHAHGAPIAHFAAPAPTSALDTTDQPDGFTLVAVSEPPGFDAIVLAGGRPTRLGGIARPSLRYASKSLLDHALDAAAGARLVVVVAPDSVTPQAPTRRVEEIPPHGGPAAAIAAGLDDLASLDPARWVLILACDYPRSEDAVAALVNGCRFDDGVDAYLATGPDAEPHHLLGVYRRDRLVSVLALSDHRSHPRVRDLVTDLAVVQVPVPAELLQDVDDTSAAARFGITLT